jgi:hypothetical protein
MESTPRGIGWWVYVDPGPISYPCTLSRLDRAKDEGHDGHQKSAAMSLCLPMVTRGTGERMVKPAATRTTQVRVAYAGQHLFPQFHLRDRLRSITTGVRNANDSRYVQKTGTTNATQ